MNFNNLLGLNEDNDSLNTILIIIIILIIIFSFGRNNQVCGYTFGCFNPANLLPTGVSPEAFERNKKCCEPCCRPYHPGSCGLFGGNFLFILIAIAFLCLFCFNGDKDKDDDDCCC